MALPAVLSKRKNYNYLGLGLHTYAQRGILFRASLCIV